VDKSLIVARMVPDSERDVAEIFARSDATDLPRQLGVRERTLFIYQGLYFHLIQFNRAPEQAMRGAADLPDFRAVSDELRAYIRAYDPDAWQSPQDAMARPFYHWSAPNADGQARTADRPSVPAAP